jgi:hypothetical protein
LSFPYREKIKTSFLLTFWNIQYIIIKNNKDSNFKYSHSHEHYELWFQHMNFIGTEQHPSSSHIKPLSVLQTCLACSYFLPLCFLLSCRHTLLCLIISYLAQIPLLALWGCDLEGQYCVLLTPVPMKTVLNKFIILGPNQRKWNRYSCYFCFLSLSSSLLFNDTFQL